MSALNMGLAKAVSSKGIKTVKQSICRILEEVFENPLDDTLARLPETVEILFFDAKKTPAFLDALVKINNNSPKVIEHTANVLALTTQYCFFNNYSDDESIKFGLCALLHDIDISHIDTALIETDEKLTDEEFEIFKTHTSKGYKDIKMHPVFDKAVGRTALEHLLFPANEEPGHLFQMEI